MRKFLVCLSTGLALLAGACLTGCESQNQQNAGGPVEMSETPPAAPPGGDHEHPSEGPHHGALVELGNEEYHAELVHDENKGTVIVYILDGSAKNAVPVETQEVTINLKHDGRGEQFKLAAAPMEGDPEGKSSRFVSNDAELGEDLHAEDAEARLVVRIGEKSYSGEVSHEHSHDHDHRH